MLCRSGGAIGVDAVLLRRIDDEGNRKPLARDGIPSVSNSRQGDPASQGEAASRRIGLLQPAADRLTRCPDPCPLQAVLDAFPFVVVRWCRPKVRGVQLFSKSSFRRQPNQPIEHSVRHWGVRTAGTEPHGRRSSRRSNRRAVRRRSGRLQKPWTCRVCCPFSRRRFCNGCSSGVSAAVLVLLVGRLARIRLIPKTRGADAERGGTDRVRSGDGVAGAPTVPRHRRTGTWRVRLRQDRRSPSSSSNSTISKSSRSDAGRMNGDTVIRVQAAV
ncbi:MAG: hypothetical protein KatS3mg082_1723 [Nitrospiraceae bacterium]|nr:MAG: hypothetical protein KatS3mg082_1723 [Nitrospiraceae bacterium]